MRLGKDFDCAAFRVSPDDFGPKTFRQYQILGRAVAGALKAHSVDAGGHLRIQILKAACTVLFDEQSYRGKDGGILGSSGSASCREPVPEADFDAVQYVQLFGKDAQPQGQHSGHAAQGEAHGHTSYLSVSAFGDKMPDGIGHCRADFRRNGVQGFDLRPLLQKIMPRMTVILRSK